MGGGGGAKVPVRFSQPDNSDYLNVPVVTTTGCMPRVACISDPYLMAS